MKIAKIVKPFKGDLAHRRAQTWTTVSRHRKHGGDTSRSAIPWDSQQSLRDSWVQLRPISLQPIAPIPCLDHRKEITRLFVFVRCRSGIPHDQVHYVGRFEARAGCNFVFIPRGGGDGRWVTSPRGLVHYPGVASVPE